MTAQNPPTEQKIKEAARLLFHQKGYEGTKTRDIAEAAGINIALMNYYFRSKKKLFDLIMMETIETFFQSVFDILWEKETRLEEKIHKLTTHYIDMLQDEPDLPIFILSEIRNDRRSFLEKVLKGRKIQDAPFFSEMTQTLLQGQDNPIHPVHLLLNFISMIVFPFAARPVVKELLELNEDQFRMIMEDRKELIPTWMQQLTGSVTISKIEKP